jgi:class 3 adenylate cyclase
MSYLADLVVGHNGDIGKLVGDQVMAVFGDPPWPSNIGGSTKTAALPAG